MSHLVVTNGQTVYVAGGAVVRGVIRPDEKFHVSSYSGLRTYSPTFVLRGGHITFRGRGIVDGSLCTTHARNLILVQGTDIALEGVIDLIEQVGRALFRKAFLEIDQYCSAGARLRGVGNDGGLRGASAATAGLALPGGAALHRGHGIRQRENL